MAVSHTPDVDRASSLKISSCQNIKPDPIKLFSSADFDLLGPQWTYSSRKSSLYLCPIATQWSGYENPWINAVVDRSQSDLPATILLKIAPLVPTCFLFPTQLIRSPASSMTPAIAYSLLMNFLWVKRSLASPIAIGGVSKNSYYGWFCA